MIEHIHDFDSIRLVSQGCGKPYKYVRQCRICHYSEELGNGYTESHNFNDKELIRADDGLAIYKKVCRKCGKEKYYTEKFRTDNHPETKADKRKIRKINLILGTIIIIFIFLFIIFLTEKFRVIETKAKEQELNTTPKASTMESEINAPEAYSKANPTRATEERITGTDEIEASSAVTTEQEAERTEPEITITEAETTTGTAADTLTKPEATTYVATDTIGETELNTCIADYSTAAETQIPDNINACSIYNTTALVTGAESKASQADSHVYETTAQETAYSHTAINEAEHTDTETKNTSVKLPEPGKLYLGSEIKTYVEYGLNVIVISNVVTEYIFPGQIEIEEGLWPPSDSYLCDIVSIDNKDYYRFTRF